MHPVFYFNCVICLVCTVDQISRDLNFRKDFNFESIKFGKHSIKVQSRCDIRILHFFHTFLLYTHLRRKSQEEMQNTTVVLYLGQ